MDWKALATRYAEDYQETRISLKQWCEQHQIDYQNARKHISVREVKARGSSASKTKRQNVIRSQPNKANRTSFSSGNQAARKHGAYASLLEEEDVNVAAQVESLQDELLVSRSRLVSVLKARTQVQKQLQQCSSVEARVQCTEVLLKLVDAEERTVARVESLCSTISKLQRDETILVKDALQTKLIEQTIEQKRRDTEQDNQVIYHIDW
ncbi:hypothetical protein AB4351_08295 [Vibrio sp. 10N.261.51.F11]|uniref:hypothetical protein n=1 Tax=Vibrio sp. 10N.261.51.F11 TaxID=3229678 RepID=UPI0035527A6D